MNSISRMVPSFRSHLLPNKLSPSHLIFFKNRSQQPFVSTHSYHNYSIPPKKSSIGIYLGIVGGIALASLLDDWKNRPKKIWERKIFDKTTPPELKTLRLFLINYLKQNGADSKLITEFLDTRDALRNDGISNFDYDSLEDLFWFLPAGRSDFTTKVFIELSNEIWPNKLKSLCNTISRERESICHNNETGSNSLDLLLILEASNCDEKTKYCAQLLRKLFFEAENASQRYPVAMSFREFGLVDFGNRYLPIYDSFIFRGGPSPAYKRFTKEYMGTIDGIHIFYSNDHLIAYNRSLEEPRNEKPIWIMHVNSNEKIHENGKNLVITTKENIILNIIDVQKGNRLINQLSTRSKNNEISLPRCCHC